MASFPISGRGFVPWPINTSTPGLVTVANPSATTTIYVESLTSGSVIFGWVKVQRSSQGQINFPSGGTVRAWAGQDVTPTVT